MDTLYAWARRLDNLKFWDHTWVTSYYNPKPPYPSIAAVKAAGGKYWYCWGSYHPRSEHPNDGALGHIVATFATAECLCSPNLTSKTHPEAQGTIFKYGRDGVCHQLANQVLAAATSGALTVRKARGYWPSSHAFGTFGTQEAKWKAKLEHCGVQSMRSVGNWDEFERHVIDVLGPAAGQKRVEQLRELRQQLRVQLQQQPVAPDAVSVAVEAERLNDAINSNLEAAKTVLGPDDYARIFDDEHTEMDLVDAEALAESKPLP